MRLIKFIRKSRPATVNGITCTQEELLDLRHVARTLNVGGSSRAYSIMAGSTLSKFRGRGMDYAESRIYTPGDDVRNIDWRVTARTGKTHTKVYIEERDRPVVVLIDFSPSLYFGTKEAFKSVVAARLAATIAWTAIFNGDRIGGIIVSPREKFELRPTAGRKGVLALIQALVKATSQFAGNNGDSSLDQLIRHGIRAVRPGSRVFLISDFYHYDPEMERNLGRLRRHNDLVLCQVIDPLEMAVPPPGVYRITNGQQNTRINTRNPDLRRLYDEIYHHRQDKVEQLARHLKLPLLQLVSGTDIAGVMRRGLSLKRHVNRHESN
ncbi:MAG: DUF58 domain-containing protein [Xanthomonadaceae bacterium]|nr:DUF58 domain-containing protein [Xanthomonadaceae bacterium]